MKSILTLSTFLLFFFSSIHVTAQINTTSQWTWAKGDSIRFQYSVYGIKGIAAAANKPGSRHGSTGWTDAAGNFWLFGGDGYATNNFGYLNDLWKYTPATNEWTWVSGDNVAGTSGVYGTMGVTNLANKPGSRSRSISWTDASGNFWLFGGYGYRRNGSLISNNPLSDLWKYNPTTNQWTWVKGDTLGGIGIYGTKGTPAATNRPGARYQGASWADAAGNLWLFGGYGWPDNNNEEFLSALNDLWKYTPSTNQWTWVNGASTGYPPGVYGTPGTPAATNTPGGRGASASWQDGAGNFWLFGGDNSLNDLWKYNPVINQWAWIKGDSTRYQYGIYGAQGAASTANKPGGRGYACKWTDASGYFWMFGGNGYAANGEGLLNDLWRYDLTTNQWTWIKGDSTKDKRGIYGTLGIVAAANKPGGRSSGASWKDTSGNFWLFGGTGYTGSTGGSLNDLWRLGDTSYLLPQPNIFINDVSRQEGNSATGAFTFTVSLSSLAPAGGVTFNISTADSTATAPGDYTAQTLTGQTIPAGNSSYTFTVLVNGDTTFESNEYFKVNISNVTGAIVSDGQGVGTVINDDPQITTASQWTWMKGDSTGTAQRIYGTQGIPAAANTPGGRSSGLSWTGTAGNFWLFGGFRNNVGMFNDLWKYNANSNEWAWMKGDSTVYQNAVYGTQGMAAEANKPGWQMRGGVTWTDADGNLWLYGGRWGYPNELWKYNPAVNQWAWVAGIPYTSDKGVYGTQGIAATANRPGGREEGVSWTDASGNFWLFGGYGADANAYGNLNDLWKYNPATNQWTWVKGANIVNQQGVYGTMGVAATANNPGARSYGATWADADGNLWLFGGSTQYPDGNKKDFNDLWKYNIATNQWTWVKGASTVDQPGIYGTQGTPATSNTPGARTGSSFWADAYGNLWLFGGWSTGYGSLSDLWKYNISTNQWTWVKGANTPFQQGVYGMLGTPAAANRPGARQFSGSWKDTSGNFWLFGGNGYAASGGGSFLNDLWKLGNTNVSFVTVNNGLWNNPSTWAGGVVPSANSIVVVRNAVIVQANASCYSLRIEGSNGNVTVATGVQFTILH